MDAKFLKISLPLLAIIGLTGCPGSDGAANSSSTPSGSAGSTVANEAVPISNTNCTVTQTSTGATFVCGNTSATILNGASGINGSQGPIGPQGPSGATGATGTTGPAGAVGAPSSGGMPRLINGDGTMVGDFVISASGGPYPNSITVWSSAMNAVVMYGGIYLDTNNGTGLFFQSSDCSGPAFYLTGYTGSVTVAPSNFIWVVNGITYLISGAPQGVAVASALHIAMGTNVVTCVPVTGNVTELFQTATVTTLAVPMTLIPGYSIQVR